MSAVGGPGGIGSGAAGVQQILALRQQIVERSQLLQQVGTAQPGAEAPAEANGPAGGFANALGKALGEVSATQAKAEALGDAWQKGEITDVARVMLARQEAGVAFEATLQVRNRLLPAYQDIMRMGV